MHYALNVDKKKTEIVLNTIDERRSQIVRNRVFKTLFLTLFAPRSSFVKSVLTCRISGVTMKVKIKLK